MAAKIYVGERSRGCWGRPVAQGATLPRTSVEGPRGVLHAPMSSPLVSMELPGLCRRAGGGWGARFVARRLSRAAGPPPAARAPQGTSRRICRRRSSRTWRMRSRGSSLATERLPKFGWRAGRPALVSSDPGHCDGGAGDVRQGPWPLGASVAALHVLPRHACIPPPRPLVSLTTSGPCLASASTRLVGNGRRFAPRPNHASPVAASLPFARSAAPHRIAAFRRRRCPALTRLRRLISPAARYAGCSCSRARRSTRQGRARFAHLSASIRTCSVHPHLLSPPPRQLLGTPPRPAGFVEMDDERDADEAVAKLDRHKNWVVERSRGGKVRRSGGIGM